MDNNSNSFDSINQFDSKYKEMGNFGKQRSACSIFALLSSYMFMETGDVSSEQHLKNLDQAVGNFIDLKIYGSITFDKLLEFQNGAYKPNDVCATSVQLIEQNILGYEHIFKNEGENFTRYAIIFLKNYNFFVVLVSKNDNIVTYHVRNCHEKTQYKFFSLVGLIDHLNTIYQFNKELDLDGYKDSDFSNIEFLIIDKKFDVKLNKNRWIIQQPEKVTHYKSEFEPFQIEGFDDDSDDDALYDGNISDDDDFITDARDAMNDDLSMQMALAMQQAEITGMDNSMGDVDMNELIKQQTEAMKAFSSSNNGTANTTNNDTANTTNNSNANTTNSVGFGKFNPNGNVIDNIIASDNTDSNTDNKINGTFGDKGDY